MTKEERKQYNKSYRNEGFGAIADRKYYITHRDQMLFKQRMRDEAKRMLRKSFRKNVTE